MRRDDGDAAAAPVRTASAAAGWMGEARFRKGGRGAVNGGGHSLTVRTVNQRRGTDWSVAARMDLLRRAILTRPPVGGATVYLTTAGFFGCKAPAGWNAGDGAEWLRLTDTDIGVIEREIGQIAMDQAPATHLAVGVDRMAGECQELWWFRGGEAAPFKRIMRGDAPEPVDLGPLRALSFVCGSIYDVRDGNPLDFETDLDGIDVVLDAGHVSLNREWSSPPRSRWPVFHRTICAIGKRWGAVFSHAHSSDFGTVVRDCDNWIVYRGGQPFPGAAKGYEILA